MSLFARIVAAFRPLDLTDAHAAVEAAERSQKAVAVRARALRMDVACGEPAEAIDRIMSSLSARTTKALRTAFPPPVDPTPPDMRMTLSRLDTD